MKRTLTALAAAAVIAGAALAHDHGTSDEAEAAPPALTGSYTNGVFTITFMEGGHHVVVENASGVALAMGHFTAQPGQMTIIDKDGVGACEEDEGANYGFMTVDGDLEMFLIADRCEGRADAATGGVWSPVSSPMMDGGDGDMTDDAMTDVASE